MVKYQPPYQPRRLVNNHLPTYAVGKAVGKRVSMKKLFLIRHGETEFTRAGKYCGHGDVPLNASGIKEARALGRKLKNVKIDKIYSSDLRRALETAKIVFPNRRILKRRGLREIDFGKFVGLTIEEAGKRYPRIYDAWANNPDHVKIPNGEAMRDFAKRVRKCFVRIYNENARKRVAIITHGGALRVILFKIQKQGLDNFWGIKHATAAVRTIEFKNGTAKIF